VDDMELGARLGSLEGKVDLVLSGQREAAERAERQGDELRGRVRRLELREARRTGVAAAVSGAVALVLTSGADWLAAAVEWWRR
jgi:hypothetical protein